MRSPPGLRLAALCACALVLCGAAPVPSQPEDLGPSEIDVSSYPPEMQASYRDLFVPFFSKFGGTARVINSERVEPADWKQYITDLRRRPPCCGACPYLSLDDARKLWLFLSYDSRVRKTGDRAEEFARLRRSLIERFEKKRGEVSR